MAFAKVSRSAAACALGFGTDVIFCSSACAFETALESAAAAAAPDGLPEPTLAPACANVVA